MNRNNLLELSEKQMNELSFKKKRRKRRRHKKSVLLILPRAKSKLEIKLEEMNTILVNINNKIQHYKRQIAYLDGQLQDLNDFENDLVIRESNRAEIIRLIMRMQKILNSKKSKYKKINMKRRKLKLRMSPEFKSTRVEMNCSVCGIKYTTNNVNLQTEQKRFSSCAKHRDEKECEICDKTFYGRNKTCSKQCAT